MDMREIDGEELVDEDRREAEERRSATPRGSRWLRDRGTTLVGLARPPVLGAIRTTLCGCPLLVPALAPL